MNDLQLPAAPFSLHATSSRHFATDASTFSSTPTLTAVFTSTPSTPSRKNWDTSQDVKLAHLRRSGKKWEDIASYFPEKTGNACRKRFARLRRAELNANLEGGAGERNVGSRMEEEAIRKAYLRCRRNLWEGVGRWVAHELGKSIREEIKGTDEWTRIESLVSLDPSTDGGESTDSLFTQCLAFAHDWIYSKENEDADGDSDDESDSESRGHCTRQSMPHFPVTGN